MVNLATVEGIFSRHEPNRIHVGPPTLPGARPTAQTLAAARARHAELARAARAGLRVGEEKEGGAVFRGGPGPSERAEGPHEPMEAAADPALGVYDGALRPR